MEQSAKFSYDEYFTRAVRSAAHARFCERVYGKDLCQHGMMDMAQLQMLLDILKPNPHSRLLELGCGNGLVAEYISDTTSAHVTGVDTSSVGIAQAVERTREKNGRLAFICGDMLTASLPRADCDAVIAIDTMYFVRELDAMVPRMCQALKPAGRMAIFYSSGIGPEPPNDGPAPPHTKMSRALDKFGLRYAACDLTPQERAHWTLKHRVLQEMRPEFDAEDETYLYYWRSIEARQVQQYLGSPYMSRYLYVTEGAEA